MSGLIGRLFSNVRGFYNEINSATLTGSIDVVITQQEDGTYTSSPFHVRFGKMGVLRSREKVVDVEINGKPADIRMKLGEAGEAFFVEEVDEPEEVPAHLATSPLPSTIDLMELGLKEMKQSNMAAGENESRSQDTTSSTSPSEDFQNHNQHLQHQHESLQYRQHHQDEFKSQHQHHQHHQNHQQHLVKDEFKSAMELFLKDKSDSSFDEASESTKHLRKKVLKKKKVGGKSSPRVMSTSVPEGGAMFDMEVSESSTEEEVVEVAGSKLSKSKTYPLTDDEEEMGSWRKNSFIHPLSDPELSPIGSPAVTRPPSPKSDTEVDRQRAEETQQSMLLEESATWEWGDFPKPPSSEALSSLVQQSEEEVKKSAQEVNVAKSGKLFRLWKRESSMKQQEADGVYLDDLQLDDPEIAKLYLGSPRSFMSIRDDDCESGRGASLPQSPHSVDGAVGGPVSFLESEVRHLGHVSLSLCGGLTDPDGVNLEKFMQKVVTFGDLCEKPNMINDPDLVVRIHDKGYFNWQVAAPMLLSNVVFHKDLPEDTVKSLSKVHMPKKKKTNSSSWFPWRRTVPEDSSSVAASITESSILPEASLPDTPVAKLPSPSDPTPASVTPVSSTPTSVTSTPSKEKRVKEDVILMPSDLDSEASEGATSGSGSSPGTSQIPAFSTPINTGNHSDICKKSLRLTTEQIKKLKLNEGVNEVTFSVTTQYQGTTRCTSHIYLWRYDDKIVISDIDGTITKSDVLGQILPIIGRDWSQSGVADLFTRINNNGYKFLYLSARAIGQSKVTKDLLKNIKQGNLLLPDGPLLLNPTSLISAFHREVIVKNPEEFKINCLRDIADLFPSSPFYAGFGNKINDVVAYRALKIPSFRIFTINHKGELTHDLSYKFQSSYTNLSTISDHFFPPLVKKHGHLNEFSSVNYWRQPLPDIENIEEEDTTLEIEDVQN